MTRNEFIDRTQLVPTDDEYSAIQQEYYNFDGDMDSFCQMWLEQGGPQKIAAARLERIRQLDGRILEMERKERQNHAFRA